ncbi:archain 1 [Coprinopsis cinerea AmutBmut pab1-1]|nr:archain 1 [Coprinopsis cinerea AmutBmut pab1-1]
MVVLAASICTKGGKPVISRQFRDMTRTRIESLLASFPKLIPTNTQHTSVETADVRYVYQPLEDLYILLITNKASNILQDIDTLHLFARVVSDICRSADEREIILNAFELLGAFDEIVSAGYRENVNLTQVKSILEMESHEEKIQEIIARNKEAEAKELIKKRARELELQRREQQRRGGSGTGYLGGIGGGVSGYSPVPRYDAPDIPSSSSRTPITPTAPTPAKAPAFKGSGLKLGAKKKQADLLDALGPEAAYTPEPSAPSTPVVTEQQPRAPAPQAASIRGSVPEVEQESVHVSIKETLSLQILRDGGVQSMELKGDMNLLIADAAFSHIRLTLSPPPSSAPSNLQFKQHPNVSKFPANPSAPRVVALKDPSKAFPLNQNVGVLKWRYAGTDESLVPLNINCWPTPGNGTCEISIEYELESEDVELWDVSILIPLPDGSYPTVTSESHTGSWSLDADSHSLLWTIPHVSPSNEETKSGSLIFTVNGDDTSVFFPVDVGFVGKGSLGGIGVGSVTKVGEGEGEEVVHSVDALVTVDEYAVV